MAIGFYADPCPAVCPTHKGEPMPEPVGPPFDLEEAWGFCRFCAFLVATTLEEPRELMFHRPIKGNESFGCTGTGRAVDVQPGTEADYIRQVSLYKTKQHLTSRRLRHQNLQAARRIAAYSKMQQVGPVVAPAAGVDTYGPIENPET